MKYFLIAGEASGDLHGSNLIKELKVYDLKAIIECWGGDKMENSGAVIRKHYRELAFMGFFEVAKNIKTILGNFKKCKSDILTFKPDVVILIDYPGFNLRMARFAFKHRIRVFYYISPKIWAWNQKRAWKIKKYVNRMFTIFPFETEFYKKFNYEVDFVGNPLLDSIEQFKNQHDNSFKSEILENKPIIAILPGSRRQEIRKSLPVMLSIKQNYPGYNIVIAGAPAIEESFYKQIIGDDVVKVIFNKTYSILENAEAALVTSGTATLEAALFKVPQVVCYKTGNISYQIAKRLIKVNYISLVNLVMNKRVVTELIQHEFNSRLLVLELDKILKNRNIREQIISGYNSLELKLGGKGASKRAAEKMVKYLMN